MSDRPRLPTQGYREIEVTVNPKKSSSKIPSGLGRRCLSCRRGRLPVGSDGPAVMTDTIQTVFAVTALLGLVSLLLPLAERLSIPYAVLLAVVGVAIGGIAGWLHDFGLSPESLLYVFLPALLFEAALNVDVRQLNDEVGPVLILAVVGVIVCTFVVGLALWPISPVGLLACVILGAIIATTDPVA